MKEVKGIILIATILFSVFILSSSSAVALQDNSDIILINSEDWVDVYSGIMYANLVGKPFNFIASREHSTRLPGTLSGKEVYLIESGKRPLVVGYKSTLEGAGFSVEERISSGGRNLNLELAGDLDVNSFILVDDTYGYNAISVCPYAVLSKSYVLFTDEENIDAVYSLLKDRKADILVYGHLGEAVTERLAEFKPEIIDYGDKFDNNIAVVERYAQEKQVDQVTLTSGDFIELGLMKGVEPILFIGKDSPPQQVLDYVKSSGIKVGVLIGNDLVKSAQTLKSKTGVSVFLKFGQGSGSGAGAAAVRDLDLLYLPTYPLNITVKDIAFNIRTNELEVTYKNEVDVFSYFRSSIQVYVGDELVQTVGEMDSVLIDAGGEHGSVYPIDLSGYDIESGLKASVFLQYGEGKKSLERTFEGESIINLVEIDDSSDIRVDGLEYDREKEQLILKITNNGPKCYVKPTLSLELDGDKTTLGGADTHPLDEGTAKNIRFDVELSEEDVEANEKVRVDIVFGERENFMANSLSQDITLNVSGGGDLSTLTYPLVIIILLIVIAVLLIAPRGKDKGKSEEKKSLGKKR